jgi:hypothetical protein
MVASRSFSFYLLSQILSRSDASKSTHSRDRLRKRGAIADEIEISGVAGHVLAVNPPLISWQALFIACKTESCIARKTESAALLK